jgi:hypothetical protein
MLLVAGVVEGFVSPSDLPYQLKFLLAAALATMLLLYLLRSPSVNPAAAGVDNPL